MTANRPGWPEHRPRCPQVDDGAVTTSTTRVGATDWRLRICEACGSVALEQSPAVRR